MAPFMDMISELWKSLGMELMIFAVTLLVTMIMKHTNKNITKKVPKKVVDEPPRGSAGPNCDRQVDRARVASDAWKLPADQPASQARPGQLEPWQVVDEVVEGIRHQNSTAFAARALALHSQLRSGLQALDMKLPEAAKYARRPLSDYYIALVQSAIRVGKPQYITEIVDDMIKQGVKRPLSFYESVMKQLAGQKQHRLALGMYDRLVADGLEPSAITCSCLISFAADIGELDRAVEFFDKLKSITVPSIRACMTVLRVHAKRQDWQGSLATLRDMQSRRIKLDSLVLNVVLATGVATDQIEGVVELLEEADTYDPPLSDVVSYNTTIKGYAARGDISAAIQAVSRMRARGLLPNAITFNTTIDAAVRATRISEAWELLAEMRSCRLKPDKFTCSILVKGLAKSPTKERVADMLAILSQVGSACDVPLQNNMYHMLFDAAATLPSGESLKKVFAQMQQNNIVPTASEYEAVAQATKQADAKGSRR